MICVKLKYIVIKNLFLSVSEILGDKRLEDTDMYQCRAGLRLTDVAQGAGMGEQLKEAKHHQ